MSETDEATTAAATVITPHLVVRDAAGAIAFYKEAFGAEEIRRMPEPGGERLMHAEIRIGGAPVMLVDEFPEFGSRSPESLGGSPVTIHLQVPDVDAVFDRAIGAGCTADMAPTDMFWGDRYARLTDPYGHPWSIATHLRDLSEEELAKAAAEALGSPG